MMIKIIQQIQIIYKKRTKRRPLSNQQPHASLIIKNNFQNTARINPTHDPVTNTVRSQSISIFIRLPRIRRNGNFSYLWLHLRYSASAKCKYKFAHTAGSFVSLFSRESKLSDGSKESFRQKPYRSLQKLWKKHCWQYLSYSALSTHRHRIEVPGA